MTAAPAPAVFVVGAGLMGSGIAAQCALAGFPVVLEDISEALVDAGVARARRALDHAVERQEIDPARREAAIARITLAVGLDGAGAAGVVVEAAPEDLALKRRLFRDLERVAAPEAILASNTSSLPIGSIGADLRDPDRLVGLHFFNPVLQMPLVELIASPRTREEVVARARRFAVDLGKTVVRSTDSPGFVTSRALAVLVNEAARMLEQRVADRDDIDAAYRLGFHHPMGPFQLVDLVGIDTTVAILDILFEGLHDERYRACPLLRTMVAQGKLGRKSGEGFYPYPARGSRRP
ncbi:MAG TPA: 3-hydroxyacyl-CoA dehydrogenase family protein [Thermoplasmata archaeon]|nr:3-hydroxyacyl-CoA dehydrogenase family protein [Thermoplasmata archaeon]